MTEKKIVTEKENGPNKKMIDTIMKNTEIRLEVAKYHWNEWLFVCKIDGMDICDSRVTFATENCSI